MLSVFFVSKTIIFVKSIRKTYENYNKLQELHEKYFKTLPAAQILLIQMKN
jgi:hypothetical protein